MVYGTTTVVIFISGKYRQEAFYATICVFFNTSYVKLELLNGLAERDSYF